MPHSDTLRIIITDDSQAFIDAVSEMLSTKPQFKIFDKCSNGLELVENKNLHRADLLLIDIEMPKLNGLEAATKINYLYPSLPMIALTMHQDKIFLADIVRAGFRAFIYKPDVPQKLFSVIEMVLSNKFVFPDNLKIEK